MKGSRLYMLFLFAFLVIVFIAEYMAPPTFEWKPTYDKYDKEPFGSYVFDDVLSSSIKNYTVVNQTFYQIFREDSVMSSRTFLLTEKNPSFNKTDIEYLYKIIQAGNQVMICTEQFPQSLQDTLAFSMNYEYHNSFVINKVRKNNVRDSIFFGTDTLNPVQVFNVLPQIHPVSIILYRDSTPIQCDTVEILVWDKKNKPLAIRATIGKGELFLVATPLMFTNFGMLDGKNASYVFRLLTYRNDKPLIRVEAYGTHGDAPRTPLRYILSEAPLRWATYSIMTLLLLFMVFTARRRQRIIPVVLSPPNRTLGFMQLISNLYYQKHDNLEMLKMKYMYFCADVNNLTGVELYERVPDEQDYERLVEKTGMEKDFIHTLLHNIRLAVYREEVGDMQLKQYIDGMNDVLQNIQ